MSEQIPLRANEQVLLRTSFFGGFEKKEVLDYINKLREQNRTLGKELEDHMLEVTSARNELSSQVNDFQGRIGEMERQLDERSDKIKELKNMINSLQGEITAGKVAQIEQERALNLQKEQNKQLTLQVQTFEHKAKRYEEVSQQLGSIMLEANAKAQGVIESANAEAEKIKEDAINTSKRVTGELVGMRTQLADIRAQIEGMINEFSAKVDALDELLAGVSFDEAVPEKPAAPIAEETVCIANEPENKAENEPEKEEAETAAEEAAPQDDEALSFDKRVMAARDFSATQNFFQGAATV